MWILVAVLSVILVVSRYQSRKRGKLYERFSARVKAMDEIGPLNDPLAAYYALKAGAALGDGDFAGCEEALSKAERYHAESHPPFGLTGFDEGEGVVDADEMDAIREERLHELDERIRARWHSQR